MNIPGCTLARLGAGALGALVAFSPGAFAASACDGGGWPLATIQAHFGGALPTIAGADAPLALGAPTLVTLAPQASVNFPHAPGRAGKANPAYAAVLQLGAQPAAIYQVTVSGGAWVDMVENGELVRQAGYLRAKDCPGVDKSLRFKSNGGPLTIQISGAYSKTIKIEAGRAE